MDEVVAQYRRLEELGRGAMGNVYLALHTPTQTPVALKFVRPDSALARALLETEILAMARLNHPGLLYLYDTGMTEDGSTYWLAVELASGGSLESWNPQSWDELADVIQPTLDALGHAHARGMVHRDLKPANLLRATAQDRRPGIKIADFGLAVVHDAQSKLTQVGTPTFMPPEQCSSGFGEVGPWSDVYALGSTVWALACGEPPFGGTVREVLHQLLHAPLPEFRPRFAVPPELEPTLRDMLVKAPEDRLRSAHQVRDRLWPGRARARRPEVVGARIPGVGAELFDRREWRMVGRRSERQQLNDALDAVCRSGQPHVVTLEGPPGVGKRRLARWFVSTTEEQGRAHTVVDPADIGEVLDLVGEMPLVVLFTDLTRAAEFAIVSLVSIPAPVLCVGIAKRPEERPGLEEVVTWERIHIAHMKRAEFHEFLKVELGVSNRLIVHMSESCSGNPGLAVRLMSHLARARLLGSTSDGFDADIASLETRPAGDGLANLADSGLGALVEECSAAGKRALRMAAALGQRVAGSDWLSLLSTQQLPIPNPELYRLMRIGAITRRADGFDWISDGVLDAFRNLSMPSDDAEAVDRLLEPRSVDADGRYRWGQHLLSTGRTLQAMPVLLAIDTCRSDQVIERQAIVVQAMRPLLTSATMTEHVAFLWMELRTTLNLVSGQAALPLALALVEAMGTPGDPTELARQADPTVAEAAWGLAALVLAFQDRADASDAILADLEETAETLRTHALNAVSRGQTKQARYWFARAFRRATDATTKARIANGLGSLLGEAGHVDEAIEWFEVCVDWMEPNQRDIPVSNLALTLLLAGRSEDALARASEAMDLARSRGAKRIGRVAGILALCALYADEERVDQVADLALFTARRQGPSSSDILLPLLEAARPRRQANVVWVRAMIHAMTTERDREDRSTPVPMDTRGAPTIVLD